MSRGDDETRKFIVRAEWSVDSFSDADSMRHTLGVMGMPDVTVIHVLMSGETEDGW